MTSLGLISIIVGWIVQLRSLSKKKNQIQSTFVGFYSLGVLFLVVDGFQNGLTSLAVLNLISLIVSALVLYKITK